MTDASSGAPESHDTSRSVGPPGRTAEDRPAEALGPTAEIEALARIAAIAAQSRPERRPRALLGTAVAIGLMAVALVLLALLLSAGR